MLPAEIGASMAEEPGPSGDADKEKSRESTWWLFELLMWIPELIVAAVRVIVGFFVALLSSCS